MSNIELHNFFQARKYIYAGLITHTISLLAKADEMVDNNWYKIGHLVDKTGLDEIPINHKIFNWYGFDLFASSTLYFLLRHNGLSKKIAIPTVLGLAFSLEFAFLNEPQESVYRFDPLDLGAYAIGVLGAYAIDRFILNRNNLS